MKPLAIVTLAGAIALASCATNAQHSGRAAPVREALAIPADPAEGVAKLLAEADSAQGDPQRLGLILAALDSLGAQAMPGEPDPVAQWRAKAVMPDTPPYRGRVLGPAYKAGMINPGATVRLPQLFDGGRSAAWPWQHPDRLRSISRFWTVRQSRSAHPPRHGPANACGHRCSADASRSC